jgi:hypothetical protein
MELREAAVGEAAAAEVKELQITPATSGKHVDKRVSSAGGEQ